jgi:hypothetical protein
LQQNCAGVRFLPAKKQNNRLEYPNGEHSNLVIPRSRADSCGFPPPAPALPLVSAGMRVPPLRLLAALALCGGSAAVLAACGKGGGGVAATAPGALPAPRAQGVGGIATKNTTRLGGGDPADDAAAVARAIYPGLTPATRPQAVALVDEHDWPAALAASSLASAPLAAPLLYAEGDALPEVSAQTLQAMHPLGASTLGGAQVIAVGAGVAAPGYRVRAVGGSSVPAGGNGTGPGKATGGGTGTGAGGGTGTGGAIGAGGGAGIGTSAGQGVSGSTGPGGAAHRAQAGEAAARAGTAVLSLLEAARGKSPHQVIVVASDAARALQMPAAGLAAESGAPILFVTRSGVPAATRAALARLRRPAIYVLAPKTVQKATFSALARLGSVTRVSDEAGAGEGAAGEGAAGEAAAGEAPGSEGAAGREGTAGKGVGQTGEDPVQNAISVSRFSHGSFGWGIHEAGHGLVFANVARALDAPAAAPLSAHGDYGPLLLLEHSASVPAPLTSYLSNIEPGYTSAIPPVREVYNHGWLIGDESAISALAQAEIDTLLEIAPRQQSAAEQSVAEAE